MNTCSIPADCIHFLATFPAEGKAVVAVAVAAASVAVAVTDVNEDVAVDDDVAVAAVDDAVAAAITAAASAIFIVRKKSSFVSSTGGDRAPEGPHLSAAREVPPPSPLPSDPGPERRRGRPRLSPHRQPRLLRLGGGGRAHGRPGPDRGGGGHQLIRQRRGKAGAEFAD